MGLTQKLGTIPLAISTDASNNVGIGGSPSGSYKLEVTGTAKVSGALTVSNGDAKFYSSGTSLGWGASATDYGQLNWNTGEAIIAATTGNQLTFRTNGVTSATNRMVITSAGNVGIGTSSPSYTLDVLSTQSNTFRLLQNINGDNYININNTSTGTSATSRMDIGVNAGSYALTIQKFGLNYSGTLFGSSCTNSTGIYDNSASSNGLFIGAMSATPIIFGTSNTERMRITSGGNVGINTTDLASVKFRVQGDDTSGTKFTLYAQDSATTALFYVRNDGVGYLKAAAWAYGSDRRIKENINYIITGLDKVMALKPATFDYIDGVKNNIGWIAQDVEEVIPEAVGTISENNDQLTLKSDFIIPYLVKAIQEQQTQIEELKALIAAK